jgi:hypothetical protein
MTFARLMRAGIAVRPHENPPARHTIFRLSGCHGHIDRPQHIKSEVNPALFGRLFVSIQLRFFIQDGIEQRTVEGGWTTGLGARKLLGRRAQWAVRSFLAAGSCSGSSSQAGQTYRSPPRPVSSETSFIAHRNASAGRSRDATVDVAVELARRAADDHLELSPASCMPSSRRTHAVSWP